MRISDAIGRKITVLGFGVEGRSVVAALRQRGHDSQICAIGNELGAAPDGVALVHSDDALRAFPASDLVVRSPGFAPHHPLRKLVDAAGVEQTTATRLFLRELADISTPIIGITGSKGKSTTSTLTQLTLTAAGIANVLVGNVGVPALELLDRITRERLAVVMELSSYQCDDLEDGWGPAIAGMVDLFPEHLDWHGGLAAYYRAKLRLITSQPDHAIARYNPLPSELLALGKTLPARAQPMNTPDTLHYAAGHFRRGAQILFSDANMLLPGVHNRRNAVAALTLAEYLGARPEHLQAVLEQFRGLPFRLQLEGTYAGIQWYNDAISTAPEAIAAALQALSGGASVATVIAGGQRRGLDQRLLVDALASSTVQTLIVMPETGEDIARAVRARELTITLHEVDTLADAVALAARDTPPGSACLFSPGAPSYNRYKSFVERGEAFRGFIRSL